MEHGKSDRRQLLQPIRPEAPTGESLLYDPVYDEIKHARAGEDARLSQGVWKRERQQPDWARVEELCHSCLQTRSKDLQLAIWLAEARLHLYGLPGFSTGCEVILNLHEMFLLSMFPNVELPSPPSDMPVPLPLDSSDGAVEHRLNMLQWFNEKLSVDLKLVPLSAPLEIGDTSPVRLVDVEEAQYLQRTQRGNVERGASLDAGLARSLALTPPDHLSQIWMDLHQAREVVQVLGDAMDHFYGGSNGGMLKVTEALDSMIRAVASSLPEHQVSHDIAAFEDEAGVEIVPSIEVSGQPSSPRVMEPVASPPSGSRIQSREHAYTVLAAVASFLAEIEPHSPVPYLLRRAIAWGGMSLPELLPELLHDQAALKDVGHLLHLDQNKRNSTNP